MGVTRISDHSTESTLQYNNIIGDDPSNSYYYAIASTNTLYYTVLYCTLPIIVTCSVQPQQNLPNLVIITQIQSLTIVIG